jgi:hypothetical protein
LRDKLTTELAALRAEVLALDDAFSAVGVGGETETQ